jgi:hypothetical protein
MFKIIIFLGISINLLFASIENEVEKERFIKENGVLIDNFTGLIWEDFKTRNRLTWWDSKRYCNDLKLYGKTNWRIPIFTDVDSLNNNIKYKIDYGTFKYYWYIDSSNRAKAYDFSSKKRKRSTNYIHYLKCVSGPIYNSRDELIKLIDKNRKKAIDKKLNDYYINIVQKEDSIKEYESFLKKYPKTSINEKIEKRLKELYSNEIKKLKKENTIMAYEIFLKNNPNSSIEDDITKEIYKLVKEEDNIAGYEWYVNKYSKSSNAKQAIEQIHKLAFEEAKDIDTISSYNTFVFNYPLAKEVKQANKKANELEREEYTSLGLLSFIGTNEKLDRKARALLIKAKQIERYPLDNNLNRSSSMGYKIVANRMYELLQKEFIESEATLRHLESQEFKDFVKDFRYVMKNIQRTLNQTNNYIKEVVSISKRGFEDAKADREMAAYYTKQHRDWEKFMHFRDKGYN